MICILFGLQSCISEPLDVNVPQIEPKVAISSQFLADSGVIVLSTRTFSALSDNYLPNKINADFIDKAFGLHSLVLIEHQNIVDTLYNMGMGIYLNENLNLEFGELCHLTVYDSIIEQEIFSDAIIMRNINFDTVYVKIINKENDTTAIIYYTLTDKPEQNFYLINNYIYKKSNNVFDFSNYLGNNPYAELLKEILEQNPFFQTLSNYGTIGTVDNKLKLQNDNDFQNTFLNDSIVFEKVSLRDTLVISIANINKDYYDYLELRTKAGTIYSQLMSDPINMPSNISNGYGMFTTHTLNAWFIDLSNQNVIKK